ncbi:hypothetical protein STEG23_029832 [Scotinomys teguina]
MMTKEMVLNVFQASHKIFQSCRHLLRSGELRSRASRAIIIMPKRTEGIQEPERKTRENKIEDAEYELIQCKSALVMNTREFEWIIWIVFHLLAYPKAKTNHDNVCNLQRFKFQGNQEALPCCFANSKDDGGQFDSTRP